MTIQNELDLLRSFAKRLGRKHEIPHHYALDIIAMQYGHPHWNALMKAWDKGWCPAPHELIDINEFSAIESDVRGVGNVKTTKGDITGEPYTLEVGFTDVVICGNGWGIHLGHAPSEPAEIEKYTSPSPLDDKTFLSDVMKNRQQGYRWRARGHRAGLAFQIHEPGSGWHCRASTVWRRVGRMVLHALRRPLDRASDGSQHVALPEVQRDTAGYSPHAWWKGEPADLSENSAPLR
ncbi:hypothetical protein [Bradyrhizobium sp. JR3.5]